MALDELTPPGGLDDLTARGRRSWSQLVSTMLAREAAGDTSVPNDSPRLQFFDLRGATLGDDAARKVMRWGAFPRKLAREPQPQRWVLGDDRNRQEEYCEWAAERDGKGRILRAFFTTEVPEYFRLLARDDPDRLLDTYRLHVSPAVRRRDLFSSNGAYREHNEWNLRGAMHMIQRNNTLGAAVLLVAQATIVRARPGGGLMANANELIRCGVAADIDRNSDPLIVGDVNELARQGAAVTLDDPIGLYLDAFPTSGWKAPDDADPGEFWEVTRGAGAHALRAVFSVPAERGYTVSDITIDGRPITSPSQIAEFVHVKVTGVAHGFGKHAQEPRGCSDAAPVGGGGGLEKLGGDDEAELLPVEDFIGAARVSR